jgi:hypothetical protein
MKAVKIFLKNLIFAVGYQRIWLKIVSFDTRGLLWNLLLLLGLPPPATSGGLGVVMARRNNLEFSRQT